MLTLERIPLGHTNGILHSLNKISCSGGQPIGTFNSVQISDRHFYTENSACLSSVHLTRGEFIEIISHFVEQ